MPTRHTSNSQRRLLAGLLLLALLAAQTLGLLHRVAHGGAALSHTPSHIEPAVSAHALPVLFAHHQDSVDCKLFDQLSHSDGLLHADLGSACMPSATLTAMAHGGQHVAAQAAGYLARGPPPTA